MATASITLRIPAIHCDGCLGAVRGEVERAGAELTAGDAETKRVTIAFDPARLTQQQLEAALEAIGFAPAGA